jgi:hypothetical protein
MYKGVDDVIHCEGKTKKFTPYYFGFYNCCRNRFLNNLRENDTKHMELEMMENKIHSKKLCTHGVISSTLHIVLGVPNKL